MYDEILYDVKGPVATIEFNRPDKLNAFTYPMLDELRHALAQAEQDDGVIGIILTGSGRGFSAGMDMQSMMRMVQHMGPGLQNLDMNGLNAMVGSMPRQPAPAQTTSSCGATKSEL